MYLRGFESRNVPECTQLLSIERWMAAWWNATSEFPYTLKTSIWTAHEFQKIHATTHMQWAYSNCNRVISQSSWVFCSQMQRPSSHQGAYARPSKRSHRGESSLYWTPYLGQKSNRVTTPCNDMILKRTYIVHSFSSVAYVWVRGAKTTGPIVKMFGFSIQKPVLYRSPFYTEARSIQKPVLYRSLFYTEACSIEKPVLYRSLFYVLYRSLFYREACSIQKPVLLYYDACMTLMHYSINQLWLILWTQLQLP
jgi:hypothetical protein